MPDAAIITALGPVFGFIAVLCWFAFQAFFGARGANSAYPKRDEKHDANQGEFRELKTMLEAMDRNHERRHDTGMGRIENMHNEGMRHTDRIELKLEAIKDRLDR